MVGGKVMRPQTMVEKAASETGIFSKVINYSQKHMILLIFLKFAAKQNEKY